MVYSNYQSINKKNLQESMILLVIPIRFKDDVSCTTVVQETSDMSGSHVGSMWWDPPHGSHPMSLKRCTTVAQLLCTNHSTRFKYK
jgi:hypothetical protein